MKEVSAMARSYRRASVIAALVMIGTLSACGGSNAAQSAPGLSCVNYAITGSGTFHNELAVQVKVRNSTPQPVHYVVEVDLVTGQSTAAGSHSHVMVKGSVPSGTSAELARKVLTPSKVVRCRVTRISRNGQS
jgi:hypothetical protein